MNRCGLKVWDRRGLNVTDDAAAGDDHLEEFDAVVVVLHLHEHQDPFVPASVRASDTSVMLLKNNFDLKSLWQ